MNHLKRVWVVAISCCFLLNFSSFAMDTSRNNIPGNFNECELLGGDVTSSKDEYRIVTRGDFLSAGSTQISNGQDGTIHVNIDTFAHFGVDGIYHTVFLDQWNEETEDWVMLDHWDFSRTKEEETDGILNALNTSFSLSGYEVGKYYRLRGLHGVEYNEEIEMCATETDGVLLTDRS